MESKTQSDYTVDLNAEETNQQQDSWHQPTIESRPKAPKRKPVEASIRRWKELHAMVKEDPAHQFVILIGKATVAKTVITATLNHTANITLGTDKGILKHKKGVAYINSIIKKMSGGDFPLATKVDYVEYYSTTVFFEGMELPLTFIEMSGEDLERFDPTKDVEMNAVAKHLAKFIEAKPRVITFLVAPANETNQHDAFLHDCLCFFQKIHPGFVNTIGVIISKWDKLPKHQQKNTAELYTERHLPATYAFLKQRAQKHKPGYHKFSVGMIQQVPEGDTIVDKLKNGISTQFAEPILNWIKHLLIDQPKKEKLTEILNGDIPKAEAEVKNTMTIASSLKKNLEANNPASKNTKQGNKRGIFNFFFTL